MRSYRDRAEGGRVLAKLLEKYRGSDCVVYGLPRGGVVTAKEVALALGAPLDLIITRKIGHPNNPEYAIGAITDEGDVVLNATQRSLVSPQWLERERTRQLAEARRRRSTYLGNRPRPDVRGKTAILVDDGIATGFTMEAALLSARKRNPAKIVVAAPVAPAQTARRFEGLADEVVVAATPDLLFAIGQWYDEFEPVEDEQVLDLLKEPVTR